MAFAPKRFLEHKYSMQVELTLNYMMEVVAFCSANNGPQIRVSKAAHGNLSESMGIGLVVGFQVAWVDMSTLPLCILRIVLMKHRQNVSNPSKHPSLTVKLQTSWEYSPKPNVPPLSLHKISADKPVDNFV